MLCFCHLTFKSELYLVKCLTECVKYIVRFVIYVHISFYTFMSASLCVEEEEGNILFKYFLCCHGALQTCKNLIRDERETPNIFRTTTNYNSQP